MRYANLSRYDVPALERMLYSYESMARTHAEHGHYALAKWANGMRVHITVELNKRAAIDARELQRQDVLFPNT